MVFSGAISLLVALLLCTGAVRAAPSGEAHSLTNLPGGIPLDLLFANCQSELNSANEDDIGPCLASTLGGIIEGFKPQFATGVPIKHGRRFVLEPLSLGDVGERSRSGFTFSATDIKLYNISNIKVENILFQFEPQVLHLYLNFEQLRATGGLGLKYLFLTASPDVQVTLNDLYVNLTAAWNLEHNPETNRLDLVLSNSRIQIRVASDLSVKIEKLGSFGRFLERLLNKNIQPLSSFFIPVLEDLVSDIMNDELDRIKLAD